jgi:urease accessory protein
MSSPEVVALMLADGRLPTGGHTQSAGLEPAARAGLGADGKQLADVAAYARDRLRTITRVEAAVAVVARHITLTTGTPHGPRLDGCSTVESAWAARTPSQALRAVSRRQGRAYLRLAARVWPDVLRYLPHDSEVARPVVVGVIGAVTGLSAEQVARLVAYDDAQTVVAASLKLLPVDPADAAGWLVGLHDDIERLVTDVAPLTEIEKIPANGAPLVDLFAQNHSTEKMRLFHA